MVDLSKIRPVEGYPGYSASSDGQVFGPRGRALKASPNRKGYLRVVLYAGGAGRSVSVASIIARAFHGPRPAGFHVAHLDGDNQHNAATNLAYVTPTENGRHQYLHGTRVRGQRAGSPLTDAQVAEIRQAYRWRSAECGVFGLAARFGVSHATIHDIVRGRSRTQPEVCHDR